MKGASDVAPPAAQPEEKPRRICCCRPLVFFSCMCCCLFLISLAILLACFLATVKAPKVSMTGVNLKQISSGNNAARITCDVSLLLQNPNNVGVTITVTALVAEVYSINKQYTSAADRGDVYLGFATLPAPLKVPNSGQANFVVTVTGSLQGNTATVAGPRWLSDCGPQNSMKTTRLLIRVKQLAVQSVVPLSVSDFDMEFNAPCDQYMNLDAPSINPAGPLTTLNPPSPGFLSTASPSGTTALRSNQGTTVPLLR